MSVRSKTKQSAASSATGAKSQGPTLQELRHGMLAQIVVLPGESKSRFEELLAGLLAAHQPVTRSEHAIVDIMAVARWYHMRAALDSQTDYQRQFNQALRDLNTLKGRRKQSARYVEAEKGAEYQKFPFTPSPINEQ